MPRPSNDPSASRLPHIDARDGYVFDVEMTLPWLGLLFRHGGTLGAA